jgi:hypothetical protein
MSRRHALLLIVSSNGHIEVAKHPIEQPHSNVDAKDKHGKDPIKLCFLEEWNKKISSFSSWQRLS